jgi:hypothetical protein
MRGPVLTAIQIYLSIGLGHSGPGWTDGGSSKGARMRRNKHFNLAS